MSTFDALDKQLAARGWQYDVMNEQFTDGERRLDDRRVRALVPGMTLDELASYQDHRYDELCARPVPITPSQLPDSAKRRTVKKKAAKKAAPKNG